MILEIIVFEKLIYKDIKRFKLKYLKINIIITKIFSFSKISWTLIIHRNYIDFWKRLIRNKIIYK